MHCCLNIICQSQHRHQPETGRSLAPGLNPSKVIGKLSAHARTETAKKLTDFSPTVTNCAVELNCMPNITPSPPLHAHYPHYMLGHVINLNSRRATHALAWVRRTPDCQFHNVMVLCWLSSRVACARHVMRHEHENTSRWPANATPMAAPSMTWSPSTCIVCNVSLPHTRTCA